MIRRRVTVLGSTGSVGSSTLDLMEQAQAQGVVTAPEPEAKTARRASGIAPVARPLMARLQIPNSVFALGSLPLAPRR